MPVPGAVQRLPAMLAAESEDHLQFYEAFISGGPQCAYSGQ